MIFILGNGAFLIVRFYGDYLGITIFEFIYDHSGSISCFFLYSDEQLDCGTKTKSEQESDNLKKTKISNKTKQYTTKRKYG